MPEGTKMVLQDRAYSSPIWYPPRPAAADEPRTLVGLTPVFSRYFPGKVHDHEDQNHIDKHVPNYPILLEKDVT
jgi:hypothetical protein